MPDPTVMVTDFADRGSLDRMASMYLNPGNKVATIPAEAVDGAIGARGKPAVSAMAGVVDKGPICTGVTEAVMAGER